MAPTRRGKSAPAQAIDENTVVIEAVLETAPQEALQDTSHPLAGSSKPITQNDFGRLFTFLRLTFDKNVNLSRVRLAN